MVKRIVRFIRDAGLTHFAYRCDREAAINAMIDDACSQLGRIGKRISNDDDIKALDMPLPEIDEPDVATEVPSLGGEAGPVVAVPELTHPGESASNGLAERSVGIVEDHVRTLLLALKVNLGVSADELPIDHPLVDG